MKPLQLLLGSRSDWQIGRLRFPRLRPHFGWLGPFALAATSLLGWPAFSQAQGAGNVALGLWVGSVSIMLMAWSFILAVRIRPLESLFGGLDKMYRVHRWAGALSVVFMWLHTSIEPEIRNGIRGASKAIADSAEDLAETGQTMLYALIGLSILRLIPYRWWRWTHKLLGVPFAFASWHFYTATKTYENGSPWGIWFAAWMVIGLVSYVWRVLGRDAVQRGIPHRVVAAEHIGPTTHLTLQPTGRNFDHRVGQFVFLKLDAKGMSEPHPFTIASAPSSGHLEFYIRHLGDWSDRLPATDLVGTTAHVEGPYGRFEPFGHPDQPVVWIAGGVGITPFLAALQEPRADRVVPTLFYAVRSSEENPIVDLLREAHREGRIDLHLFVSGGERLSPASLSAAFPDGLAGGHVALCGPAGLVSTMSAAATDLGATAIETEDFDIRQGFGPERSRQLSRLIDTSGNHRPVARDLVQ